MSPTLVTGADSLIGAHLARALLDRGERVRLLVSGDRAQAVLAEFGLAGEAEVLAGRSGDKRTLRRAMRGVSTLYHVPEAVPWRAGWRRLHDAHVAAAEVVLGVAVAAGVERVVHTSSAVSLGPAPPGSTADETQPFSARHGFAITAATHSGERVALRYAELGLPVVLALPGLVFGRGDHAGGSTEVVRRFMLRQIPFTVPGAVSVVGAADLARGLMLCAERGRVSERYLLGGRNFTTDRLYADLGRLTGIAPPALRLPLGAALALTQVPGVKGRLPSRQALRMSGQWWAYRSTRARDELGWRTGHHEDPLVETIDWYREQGLDAGRSGRGAGQPLALRVAGFGVRRTSAVLDRLRFD